MTLQERGTSFVGREDVDPNDGDAGGDRNPGTEFRQGDHQRRDEQVSWGRTVREAVEEKGRARPTKSGE